MPAASRRRIPNDSLADSKYHRCRKKHKPRCYARTASDTDHGHIARPPHHDSPQSFAKRTRSLLLPRARTSNDAQLVQLHPVNSVLPECLPQTKPGQQWQIDSPAWFCMPGYRRITGQPNWSLTTSPQPVQQQPVRLLIHQHRPATARRLPGCNDHKTDRPERGRTVQTKPRFKILPRKSSIFRPSPVLRH